MLPSHSPPIIVLSRKKPHLIFFQVLVILSGLSVFVNIKASEIPNGIIRICGGFLLVSGLTSLIAHLQRLDRGRGLYLERGALLMQFGVVLIYAALLIAYIEDHVAMAIALLTNLAWAGANLWEIKLISADLKMINVIHAITFNLESETEMNDAA